MPDENVPTPEPAVPDQPTLLGGLAADEMLARGMQSVKMTSGTAGTWQPPAIAEAANLFAGYEVLRLLGRGGMGAVYQARQIELDRIVAIKLLPLEISVDKEFADRFRREARAMAKLNHPNIITVHDFGTTREGHLYFAMEYVEGANLAAIIHQVGLDSDQALSIAEQVCAALSYAHDKGIIHRDIKPANVMIDTESHVKVADFGLARLIDSSATDLGHTMTGTVMGTPDYMAPEQMRGMNVDHRADIYSVGVMIYEMLCREVPRGAFAPPSVRGGCDARIDAIVLKAMQPDPEGRFQSTREMKREVSATRLALDDAAPVTAAAVPLPKPPKGAVTKAPPPPGAAKSKTPLFVGLAAVVVLLAAAAFFLFKPKSEPPAKAQTDVSDSTGGTRSVVSQTSVGEGGKRMGADGASPFTATKDAPFVNSLGMKFVPVPIQSGPSAGQQVLFSVWDTRVQDYAAYAGAKKVDDSWTKQQKNGVPVSREADYPVVGVSWEDAQAFCQWLTEKDIAEGKLPKGMKYRLPMDEEWSWAAGLPTELGATPAAKSLKNSVDFPWGKDYPPTKKVGNYADEAFHAGFPLNEDGKDDWNKNHWIEDYTDGYPTASPVGSFPANGYGLYDMGGNVRQWCEDWSDASHKDRVFRGASWSDSDRNHLLFSNRFPSVPTARNGNNGFRCVLSVSGPPAAGVAGQPTPAAAPSTAVLEPGAIRLWDAPEKIPKSWPGARWEDDALVLDHKQGAYGAPIKSLNGIIRASIRMNPDAMSPQIQLRAVGFNSYTLDVDVQTREIILNTVDNSHYEVLKSWPLPRAYGADEWVRVELRAVGDELTASLDGQILGTIHDTSQSEPGKIELYATARGYFRDIVYVPLDEPGTPAPAPARPATAATKDAPFVNSLGMKFVPVPIPSGPSAGQTVLFGVWDTRVQDYAVYAAANPKVDGGWRTANKDGVPAGRELDHPVVGVSWDDAQAFCKWLTEKDIAEGKLPKGLKYRLPSDEEWSWAVGLPPELGTTPAEKSRKDSVDFPWGKEFPPRAKVGNYADETFHAKFPPDENGKDDWNKNHWIEGYTDGYAMTSPVGSFPANGYGLYDMGGNVWQWCEDWFDASHTDRVLRGAAWNLNDSGPLLSSFRDHHVPEFRGTFYGFRCVVGVSAR